MEPHKDRYVPAQTNTGWGFATLVIGLAVACIAAATYIHKATYKHPTDLTMHSRGGGSRKLEAGH